MALRRNQVAHRHSRSALVLAELHGFERFAKPRQLMAYLGLVPSESSSGASVHRGAITKTGNATCVDC